MGTTQSASEDCVIHGKAQKQPVTTSDFPVFGDRLQLSVRETGYLGGDTRVSA